MKLLIFTQKIDQDDSVLGFVLRWIEEFSIHIEQITVICLYKGKYTLPSNVKVLSLGKEEGVSRFTYLVRFYRYVWNERDNYEYVWVHMNQIYVVLGGLLWRLMGKKIGLWYAHKTVSLSLKIAEKLTHHIFTPGITSFRLPSKKIHVMGQGIDTVVFSPKSNTLNSNSFTIVTVGRISVVKNYETILSAVEDLVHKGVPVRLLLIGGVGKPEDKPYYDYVCKLASSSILSKVVTLVGPLSNPDIVEYLRSADVFVNSSLNGSLDKTGLEAMATGAPVLTCNEAYQDMLEPYGLMFKPKDIGDLSGKLQKLYKLEISERKKIGDSLRSIVEKHHSLPRLVKLILTIFNA